MWTVLAGNQRREEVRRATSTERIRSALKRKGQGEKRCVPHAVTANPDSSPSPALPPAPTVLLTHPPFPPNSLSQGGMTHPKEREEENRGAEGMCSCECARAFLPLRTVVVSSLPGCRCPSHFLHVRRTWLIGRFVESANFGVSIR